MEKLCRNLTNLEIDFPDKIRQEKILQFGEGNFLRAFVDYFIDELNTQGLFNGSIVIVQPIGKDTRHIDMINAQDSLYTVVLRGLENNEKIVRQKVVSSVSRVLNLYRDFDEYMDTMKNSHLRFIVSNTTEAGIAYSETVKPTADAKEPPGSFPAKVTALLLERFNAFNGDPTKGFIFIPCELIDYNGIKLKETVLRHSADWGLPQEFVKWVNDCNHFTNTLVDRIVTGYPRDEADEFAESLGYQDNLLVTGEIFHFFAIEAGAEASKEIDETLPFRKAGLDVVLTDDATPYKLRKVRILNGAHTMSVLAAHMAGKETVGEMMEDSLFVDYLRKGIFEEIIPTLSLPENELKAFADSVFDRFANPFIKHYLMSIALNSVAKYNARVLPTILDYHNKFAKFPAVLTFSFAALIAFYKENGDDSPDVLDFMKTAWQSGSAESVAATVLANKNFWGADLTEISGFVQEVAKYLHGIETKGIKHEIHSVVSRRGQIFHE